MKENPIQLRWSCGPVFFLWKGAFANHSLGYYFSLNEYTTVGSNYSLPFRWQLLESMIAIAGLLTFAWSTGILLTSGYHRAINNLSVWSNVAGAGDVS